ncbi:hypothetical protein C7B65_11465 [Phormidesmis priestleyi ULC007]|uniref:Uncharacterized protein n=1 Tax=Phormidesmis priestleyi ULC007 TaxID=1920490 RepID=A0A2T1DGB7_9CYAN|nr:hypothetical protein [Phormidesmis priestleyi]PSB19528.1 hypothetical protein C7B65_11465 [Phormidesmis priestleyi ULC007]PZO53032.1 MAG: hypothetical protein DCF14_05290 [Phormidesmis priestleyi]
MTTSNETDGIYPRLDRVVENIEMLTEQVGRLTEGLTEIRLTTQQQAIISQQQADNITRLVTIVDRQTQMFEKLFDQQQP